MFTPNTILSVNLKHIDYEFGAKAALQPLAQNLPMDVG